MIDERRLYDSLLSDWNTLPNFINFFENEAKNAKASDLSLSGSIEKQSSQNPLKMDHRFTQLQFLNAALDYFEKQLTSMRGRFYKQYLEKYPRALSSRDVERYIDAEQDVLDLSLIINEISLLRNIFISITKAIDDRSYQLTNISKLRSVGLDDATID